MRTIITNGKLQRMKAQLAIAMSEVILSHAITWEIDDVNWKIHLQQVVEDHYKCLASLNRFPLPKDHQAMINRKIKKIAPYLPIPSDTREVQGDKWAGLSDFCFALIDEVVEQCVDYGDMICWRQFSRHWEHFLRNYMYAAAKDREAVEMYGHPLGGKLHLAI